MLQFLRPAAKRAASSTSGSLRDQLRAAHERATMMGGLHPISASHEVLYNKDAMPFFISTVDEAKLKRKPGAAGSSAKPTDAFENPEPLLTVTTVHDSYNLVLNKFPVIEQHAVLVTKEFVEQAGVLSVEDVKAMWYCIRELDAIGFYNSGPLSGASQPRRHMQLIPLAALDAAHKELGDVPSVGVQTPISAFRQRHDWLWAPGVPFALPEYPFRHAVSLNGRDLLDVDEARAAELLHGQYLSLLDAVSANVDDSSAALSGSSAGTGRPGVNTAYYPSSYNMLMTTTWMMVVPRAKADYDGLAINAVAFAGMILVKPASVDKFRSAGDPVEILKSVAGNP